MLLMAKISKILEIDNCNKDILFQALYKAEFWETINPSKKMEANFIAPNVLYTKIYDEIDVVHIPIEMEGELVLSDKGEIGGKGRLVEFNVRNNKDIKQLEGRMRIKALSPTKTKLGVFVENFALSGDFLSLIGSIANLTLQTKITEMMRNIEKYCKTKDLKDFL